MENTVNDLFARLKSKQSYPQLILAIAVGILAVSSVASSLESNLDNVRAWHGDSAESIGLVTPHSFATSYLIYADKKARRGDFASAESILSAALERPTQERSSFWMFHLARILSKQGKSVEASTIWRESGLATIPSRFCEFSLREGNLEQASDWCYDLPAIVPNVENYCLHAEYLRRSQKYAEAEISFALAIATDLAPAECLANFGRLLYVGRRYVEAVKIFEKAVTRDPQVAYLVELGNTLLRLERVEYALNVLESAYTRSATPKDRAIAAAALGSVHYREGNYLGARSYIEEAIYVGNSVDPSTYRMLARIERQLQNSESSIVAYRKAISGLGNNPDPLLLAYRHELAEYLVELGRYYEAQAIFREIISIAPGDERAREVLR